MYLIRIIRPMVFTFLLVISFISFSAENNTTKLCGKKKYPGIGVSLSDITSKISLKAVVLKLIELDMFARQSILQHELPDDMLAEKHLVNLKELSDVNFLKKAECIVEAYRNDDIIYEYKITNESGSEKGYAVVRDHKIIAYTILESQRI